MTELDEPVSITDAAIRTSSPLLDKLPPEIRNQIWRLVLKAPAGIWIALRTIRHRTRLLETCRQIRQEASSIYYAENNFFSTSSLGTRDMLFAWLDAIGHENARHIRDLIVSFVRSEMTRTLAQTLRDHVISGQLTTALIIKAFGPTRKLAQNIVAAGVRPQAVRIDDGSGFKPSKDWEGFVFVGMSGKFFTETLDLMSGDPEKGAGLDEVSQGTKAVTPESYWW